MQAMSLHWHARGPSKARVLFPFGQIVLSAVGVTEFAKSIQGTPRKHHCKVDLNQSTYMMHSWQLQEMSLLEWPHSCHDLESSHIGDHVIYCIIIHILHLRI